MKHKFILSLMLVGGLNQLFIKNSVAQTIEDLPDLTIENYSIDPKIITAGSFVNLSLTVKNKGNAYAPAYEVNSYLSKDRRLSNNDVKVNSFINYSGLNPGEDELREIPFRINGNIAPGAYYLISSVDDNNSIKESSEKNNLALAPIRILKSRADLTIPSLSVDLLRIAPGTKVNIITILKNIGSTQAEGILTNYYLSRDKKVDKADELIERRYSDTVLGPGKEFTDIFSINIPLETTAGRYYLIAKTDADNVIPENSESNNSNDVLLIIDLKANTLPDLIIRSVTSLDTIKAGTSLDVTFTIINQGGVAADPNDVVVVLSRDSLLDPDDQYIDVIKSVESLEAGNSEIITGTVLMPEDVFTGDVYLLVVADGSFFGSIVTESNEENNASGRPLTILPANANLLLDEATVSTDINAPGAELQVNAFPNPVSSILKVEVSKVTPGKEVSFVLYDKIGKKVLSKCIKADNVGTSKTEFNLRNISADTYILKVKAQKFQKEQRVIISR